MSSTRGHGHELLPKSALPAWVRWIGLKRAGVLWIVGAVSLVLVVRFLAMSNRPVNWDAIVAEIGTVAEFWGNPSPSHEGDRIVFQQSTEYGVGIFHVKLTNGLRHLVFEQPEKGFDHRNFQVWSWSPDDRWFALSRRPDQESKREIVICDGQSGEIVTALAVDRTVQDLVWLSPQAFAYVDDYQELQRVERMSDKKWGYPQAFKKRVGKKIKLTKEEQAALPKVHGLAALTADTAIFQQGQAVWSWGFGASEPVKLWEASTNWLVDFRLSDNRRQLLLHCKDSRGEPLFGYHLDSKYQNKLGVIPSPEHYTNRMTWFNGTGHAYMKRDVMAKLLCVKAGPDSPTVELDFNVGLNNFVGQGRSLFVYGSRVGEPVSIWRYDAGGEGAVCVVSNTQPSFKHASAINPTRGMLTNVDGSVISYQVWSPPNGTSGKKYPLLIGKGSSRWQGYPASIANVGAYFVSISNNSEDSGWADKVMPLYEYLQTKLRIDADNLYVYGASGSTQPVCDLLEKYPRMWRGAILFSPGVLPELSRIKAPRLLIDCGGEDVRSDVVAQYRDEAAKAGRDVTVSFHENAGHVYRSVGSLRARDEAVVKFLFGR